jgi:DNA integrity scanning protein DisA with diadenylate cyclase activity
MSEESILIVEGDGVLAVRMQEMLRKSGYHVSDPVAFGEDALVQIAENRPDIVLVDIELMGEIDGIETSRIIQEKFDVPVIFLTAYVDDRRLKQAVETYPYGYIVKPFMDRELLASIDLALHHHARDRRLKNNRDLDFLKNISSDWWERNFPKDSDICLPVIEKVLLIASQISRDGREGKKIGTAFIVGDSEEVMRNSNISKRNPVKFLPLEDRQILDPDINEYIKEMAQIDGAFVIDGKGFIDVIGCRFNADMKDIHLPDGYGLRHTSVAAITRITKSIGIVVSQSGGKITIFRDGKIINESKSG